MLSGEQVVFVGEGKEGREGVRTGGELGVLGQERCLCLESWRSSDGIGTEFWQDQVWLHLLQVKDELTCLWIRCEVSQVWLILCGVVEESLHGLRVERGSYVALSGLFLDHS